MSSQDHVIKWYFSLYSHEPIKVGYHHAKFGSQKGALIVEI